MGGDRERHGLFRDGAFQAARMRRPLNRICMYWRGQVLPTLSGFSFSVHIVQQCGRFATYRRVSCPFASTICTRITACSIGNRRQDLTRATLRGEFRGLLQAFYGFGRIIMTIASLKIESNVTAREEILVAKDARTLIARQLGVDVKRVTDEAHFADDLGADWLDRLELMLVIEDRYTDLVITDEDVDQIEVVGDLIRHIENVHNGRRRCSIVEAPLQ